MEPKMAFIAERDGKIMAAHADMGNEEVDQRRAGDFCVEMIRDGLSVRHVPIDEARNGTWGFGDAEGTS